MALTVKYDTLVANTAKTLTLDQDFQTVDVVNISGAAALYVRTDGTPATGQFDDNDYVPGVANAVTTMPAYGKTTNVSIISSANGVVMIAGRI